MIFDFEGVVEKKKTNLIFGPAESHFCGGVDNDAPVKLGLGCYGSGVVSVG